MGFGLPDDRIHGANEKFHLPNFHKGIETSIRFLAEIGARQAANHMETFNQQNSGADRIAMYTEPIS
jgi:hypothetical protein